MKQRTPRTGWIVPKIGMPCSAASRAASISEYYIIWSARARKLVINSVCVRFHLQDKRCILCRVESVRLTPFIGTINHRFRHGQNDCLISTSLPLPHRLVYAALPVADAQRICFECRLIGDSISIEQACIHASAERTARLSAITCRQWAAITINNFCSGIRLVSNGGSAALHTIFSSDPWSLSESSLCERTSVTSVVAKHLHCD